MKFNKRKTDICTQTNTSKINKLVNNLQTKRCVQAIIKQIPHGSIPVLFLFKRILYIFYWWMHNRAIEYIYALTKAFLRTVLTSKMRSNTWAVSIKRNGRFWSLCTVILYQRLILYIISISLYLKVIRADMFAFVQR